MFVLTEFKLTHQMSLVVHVGSVLSPWTSVSHMVSRDLKVAAHCLSLLKQISLHLGCVCYTRPQSRDERTGNHRLKHCTGLRLYFQEGSVYFLKGGPFLCVPPPAAQHDLVERVWAQHGLRQVDLHGGRQEMKSGTVWCLKARGNACVHALTCRFWSLKNSPVFSITCSSVSWE